MDKRKCRDYLRLIGALFFSIFYFPHIIIYLMGREVKDIVNSDIQFLEALDATAQSGAVAYHRVAERADHALYEA